MSFYNPLGYSCLTPEMLKACMGSVPSQEDIIDPLILQNVEKELHDKFQVPIGVKEQPHLYSDDFFVPPLLGDTIEEHFENMAEELISKARPGMEELISNGEITEFAEVKRDEKGKLIMKMNTSEIWEDYRSDVVDLFIPNGEELFIRSKSFWNRFEWNKESLCFDVTHPDSPSEKGILFDVETYVMGSHFAMPILASAVHPTCVYLWVHPALLDDDAGYGYDPITCRMDPHSSPMPSLGEGKFIVGHSIQYDCPRYAERYQFTNTPVNFWFDTQSAHTLTSGLSSSQRWATKLPSNRVKPQFMKYGSAKSLVASYNFNVVPLLGYPELKHSIKKIRDAFVVAPSLGYLRKMLPDLMLYSLKDSVYTLQLFQALWPKYQKAAPSKVMLASHFLLAHSLIPVEDDWFEWINEVEDSVTELEKQQAELLIGIAQDTLEDWYQGKDPNEDPWLSKLQWDIVGVRESAIAKQLNEECLLRDCVTKEDFLEYGVKPIPRWFKDCKGGSDLTAKKVDTHYLMKISYLHEDGKYYPVEKTKDYGWGIYSNGEFIRIPHYSGEEKNVGTLLSDKYIPYFENGKLRSEA